MFNQNGGIMKQATVNLFFDTRRDDNKIKLNVIFERKQKLFSTGIKVSKTEWERLKKNAEKDSTDGKIKDDNFLDVCFLISFHYCADFYSGHIDGSSACYRVARLENSVPVTRLRRIYVLTLSIR